MTARGKTQIKIGKDKDVVVEASDEIPHVKYYIVDGFNVEKIMYLGKEITTIKAVGMTSASSLKTTAREGTLLLIHDTHGISYCATVEEGASMMIYIDHTPIKVINVKEVKCPNKGEIDFAVQQLNKHGIEPISYFGAWEYEMAPIPLATLLANGVEIGFE